MGQIKNIKLHIVTDIKGNKHILCSTFLTMGYHYMEKSLFQNIWEEKQIIDRKYTGWRRTFNSESIIGRRNVVFATFGFYFGVYCLIKMKRKNAAPAPAE